MNPETIKRFSCKFCIRKCKSFEKLQKHIQIIHERPFKLSKLTKTRSKPKLCLNKCRKCNASINLKREKQQQKQDTNNNTNIVNKQKKQQQTTTFYDDIMDYEPHTIVSQVVRELHTDVEEKSNGKNHQLQEKNSHTVIFC